MATGALHEREALKESLRTQSLFEYAKRLQNNKKVEGTSEIEVTEPQNTALPVSVENEPLQRLNSMIQILSGITGIEFSKLDRFPGINDQSFWEISGTTISANLSFRVKLTVDEAQWTITTLVVDVPEQVENELAELLDIVQEKKCMLTFCNCYAVYGELFESRKLLFRYLKMNHPELIRIEIDPMNNNPQLSTTEIIESSTTLMIEPEDCNLFARFEWQATFAYDDDGKSDGYNLQAIIDFTLEPQATTQFNKEDLQIFRESNDNFMRIAENLGIQGALEVMINLLTRVSRP